jgi:hypothetical protein
MAVLFTVAHEGFAAEFEQDPREFHRRAPFWREPVAPARAEALTARRRRPSWPLPREKKSPGDGARAQEATG